MDELVPGREPVGQALDDRTPVAWRDLRDWLKLVEQAGQLKRIDAPVNPDEELGAITFMAGRNTDAPALLFNNLVGNETDARVLSNMLGSSKERYAISVGLDPDASTSDLIMASRDLMKRRLAPKRVAKSAAPVNEIVEQGDEIDVTTIPEPEILAGRRRALHRHRRHHFHARSGDWPHQCRRLSADGARARAHRALLFAREAWPA